MFRKCWQEFRDFLCKCVEDRTTHHCFRYVGIMVDVKLLPNIWFTDCLQSFQHSKNHSIIDKNYTKLSRYWHYNNHLFVACKPAKTLTKKVCKKVSTTDHARWRKLVKLIRETDSCMLIKTSEYLPATVETEIHCRHWQNQSPSTGWHKQVDVHSPYHVLSSDLSHKQHRSSVFKYAHRLNDKLFRNSYQFSHIYDNLFAPKLSSERQLDRPFRRRLQSRPKRQQY